MLEFGLHATVAMALVAATLAFDHYKARVLSVLYFWDKHPELLGSYAASWWVEETSDERPAHVVEDFIRIRWAAGGYVVGDGTAARFGPYAFSGTYSGEALALTYRGSEKERKNHIGVVYLSVAEGSALAGRWAQSRPDHPGAALAGESPTGPRPVRPKTEGGTVKWEPRAHAPAGKIAPAA